MNLNRPEYQHTPATNPSPETISNKEPGILQELAGVALAGTEHSPARVAAHEANMLQKKRRLQANARNITLFEAKRRDRLDLSI